MRTILFSQCLQNDFVAPLAANLGRHHQRLRDGVSHPAGDVFGVVLVADRDARPVVVTVRRAARELVLVLPLVATGRVVRTLAFADLGVADYNLPVASRFTVNSFASSSRLSDRLRCASLRPSPCSHA